MRRLLLAGLFGFAPSAVWAHGGLPSIAPVEAPSGVGIVVDSSYEIRWTDLDMPVPTGTATVDLHYTRVRPATFGVGEIPDELTGVEIVGGILEKDTTNRYTWDTSTVPSGSYWIWSFVNEPPTERDPFPVVSFSQGVVTVAHGEDDVRPAIILTSPETPYDFANESYVIRFESFDPDESAHVTIEARHDTQVVRVADDIPSQTNGAVIWETSSLDEGDWVLSATIADARGHSFTAHGTHPVWVTHRARPDADAGVMDAEVTRPSDGGDVVAVDSGVRRTMTAEPGGCRCVANPQGPSWYLVLLVFLLRRRSAT